LRTQGATYLVMKYLKMSDLMSRRISFHSRKFCIGVSLVRTPIFNHIPSSSYRLTISNTRNRGHHTCHLTPFSYFTRAPSFHLLAVPASILSHSNLLASITRTCFSLGPSFLCFRTPSKARYRRMFPICLTPEEPGSWDQTDLSWLSSIVPVGLKAWRKVDFFPPMQRLLHNSVIGRFFFLHWKDCLAVYKWADGSGMCYSLW